MACDHSRDELKVRGSQRKWTSSHSRCCGITNLMLIVVGDTESYAVILWGENTASFPQLLVPASGNNEDARDLIQAIKNHKEEIQEYLHESGAILFRGFEVNSASDFEHVVDALGYKSHDFSGGVWLVMSGPKVSTVDFPVELPLDYHNEGAFLKNPPSKMMLFCEVEPPTGQGTTSLLKGHEVYEELKSQAPEFVQQIQDKKLIYGRELTESAWKSMLGTDDRQEAEKRVKMMDAHIAWLEDGGAVWYSNPREGVVRDEAHGGRDVWFNSIAAMMQAGGIFGSKAPTFGDGSSLPEEGVRACREIAKKLEVSISWCKGDVLLLDNKAVMHSKQPCSMLERSILISLAA